MRLLKPLLKILPVVLLFVVGVHQIWLSHASPLSPWLGGGFGMFSATDALSNRHLHAYLVGPEFRREIFAPESLWPIEDKILGLPTKSRLRRFAAELLAVTDLGDHRVETLELHVWTTTFDTKDLQPSGKLLQTLIVEVDAP